MFGLDQIPFLKSVGVVGVVAAVAASWSTVKNVLRQISAFLVIQTKLDGSLSYNIKVQLKKEWKTIPTGINSYVGLWLTHSDNQSKLTPFRILNTLEVFYKDKQFVIVKSESESSVLYSIRGLFDPVKFINKILSQRQEDLNDVNRKHSNYMIVNLRGTAGDYFNQNRTRNNDVAESPVSGGGSVQHMNHDAIDTSFQQSIMYPLESYSFSNVKDPFENYHYSQEIREYVEEAKLWLNSKKWYLDRSIPWRRGWLLYGPGGTGKSKFAAIIAQVLGIKLYNMVLSTMTDNEFISAWEEMEFPCVVLFDDFDTVFNKRENITTHKSLSFETVLQTISGVKSTDGVFLAITTNHIDKIDEAMGVSYNGTNLSTRPGRIDRVIYMGPASEYVREKIVSKVLKDWPNLHNDSITNTNGYTVAQVVEYCREQAFLK